jgi:hypothetical protein
MSAITSRPRIVAPVTVASVSSASSASMDTRAEAAAPATTDAAPVVVNATAPDAWAWAALVRPGVTARTSVPSVTREDEALTPGVRLRVSVTGAAATPPTPTSGIVVSVIRPPPTDVAVACTPAADRSATRPAATAPDSTPIPAVALRASDTS